MAEVLPFLGTRYDSRMVGGLGSVICPPYDVITPELQDALYSRHKNNFVRVELAKELATDDEYNNRYERAAHAFLEWKRESVLLTDEDSSYYLLEQEFEALGQVRRRRGFFAAVKLDDGPDSKIRAHEQTFPGPKADRLKLLRATQVNLSPVFVLCADRERRVVDCLAERMALPPLEEFVDTEGVKTRLWIVQAPLETQQLQEAMREEDLLIADGHHRYETALNYQAEMRKALGNRHKNMPFDFAMMLVTSIQDEGLVILPTHRALQPDLGADVDLDEVVGDLGRCFEIRRIKVNLDQPREAARQLIEQIAPEGVRQVRLGMVLPNWTAYILTLRPELDLADVMVDGDPHPAVRGLDVSILHQFVIKQIWIGNPEMDLDEADVAYSRDAAVVLERLKRRRACVAFLVNAPRIEQVQEIAAAGLRMPHKSTFFYPKIPSGVVMREISRRA